MKRFAVTLLAVMFILAGCGKSDSTTPTKDNDNSAQVSYTINNIKIIPGTDFSGAYKELGEPVKYTEAASCYFAGMDKVFTYDGFEVRTYPAESGDFIQDLSISSDRFSTDKGITVGATVNEVVAAYGDNYVKTGNMYKYYEEGDKYIYFFFLNDTLKYFGCAIDTDNK